jgi:hypothetical protein
MGMVSWQDAQSLNERQHDQRTFALVHALEAVCVVRRIAVDTAAGRKPADVRSAALIRRD